MRILLDPANRYALTRFALKCAFFIFVASLQGRWGFAQTLASLLFLAALLDIGIALVRQIPFRARALSYWHEAAASFLTSLLVIWTMA
jgi:hypothetical protein